MHVNIGNRDAINKPNIQLLTSVLWMLWKESIFPMQGHFVEFTVEFQALKLAAIPRMP